MSHEIIVHIVRHGHIPSHDSDVALTEEGRQAVYLAGRQLALAVEDGEAVSFLHGPARRARETAWGMYHGLKGGLAVSGRGAVQISAPVNHPGLRNLGLMVQGRLREAMRLQYDIVRAEYLADSSPENAGRLEFHRGFWNSDDPIGYWLTHPSPHAEDPNKVAVRIAATIRQLLGEPTPPSVTRRRIICASHSATMRAFLREILGDDPGEPDFCESFTVERMGDGRTRVVFRGRSKDGELRGSWGNSEELGGTWGNSEELRGSWGNSEELGGT